MLIALHKDAVMQKHVAEGIISLQVLEGELIFATAKESKLLRKVEIIALHKGWKHSVKANKETVFLLTLTTSLGA